MLGRSNAAAAAAVVAVVLLLVAACAERTAEPVAGTGAAPGATDGSYVPEAVFCADGSGSLCGVMPSMIGPDPVLRGVGYQGLSEHVSSSRVDAQTPFDNMAWQMFVALNQVEGGAYGWQGYTRVEDVFGGGEQVPFCPNPQGLPMFTLDTKADGQPSGRGEEFLQAATDKPLIDRNGNWTVYERRINDVEIAYLKNDKWDLTTLAGQKAFVEAGHTVDFTESADATAGALGAIELKLAWRILDRAKGDDPSRFLTLDALLAVDAAEVRGSDQPLCDTVQLGLVGFHIIQKNPKRDALRPQWIWASFEHQDNVPLSPTACDPVDAGCFVVDETVCTAPTNATGTYSYFDASCTGCPLNQAPEILPGEKTYLWSPQQPYAEPYLYDGAFGTQVARCWQIYHLTRQLNDQWRQELGGAGSILANYVLIGTQWGGDLEPIHGEYQNGGVPAFLSNSTLETYIQTADFGTCLGCHSGATLAYTTTGPDGKTVTYDADFSFLLGLAE